MFVAICLFIFGALAVLVGAILVVLGLSNMLIEICALLSLLIGAVLCSGSLIIGAIMDLEKTLKGRFGEPPKPAGEPPALPRI